MRRGDLDPKRPTCISGKQFQALICLLYTISKPLTLSISPISLHGQGITDHGLKTYIWSKDVIFFPKSIKIGSALTSAAVARISVTITSTCAITKGER